MSLVPCRVCHRFVRDAHCPFCARAKSSRGSIAGVVAVGLALAACDSNPFVNSNTTAQQQNSVNALNARMEAQMEAQRRSAEAARAQAEAERVAEEARLRRITRESPPAYGIPPAPAVPAYGIPPAPVMPP